MEQQEEAEIDPNAWIHELFDNQYTLEDFCNTVENFPDEEVYEVAQVANYETVKSPRSPRRKTLGAVVAELKIEIQNIRLELEIRDAYIIALIDHLKQK
jgi:hypothetical protein